MFCLFFYDSKIFHLLLPMSRTNPGKLQVFIGFPLIQNKAKGVPRQLQRPGSEGASFSKRTKSQVQDSISGFLIQFLVKPKPSITATVRHQSGLNTAYRKAQTELHLNKSIFSKDWKDIISPCNELDV